MDVQKIIEENPTLLIYVVCGVALLFVVGFIIAKVASTRKRKRLREENGLAEIAFDATVRAASRMLTDLQFAGYKVYSVNGQEPRIVGNGIVVNPGPCSIEIEYVDTDYAGRKNSLTTLYGKRTIELQAKQRTRYKVTFNKKTDEFEVQEA